MINIFNLINKLCKPALIYLIFSITQIVFDIFNNFLEMALLKMVVLFLITFLLDNLCKSGLDKIAWFIVFIPFMLMTIVISILLLAVSVNSKDLFHIKKNNGSSPSKKWRDLYDDIRIEYAYVYEENKPKKIGSYSDYEDDKRSKKLPNNLPDKVMPKPKIYNDDDDYDGGNTNINIDYYNDNDRLLVD